MECSITAQSEDKLQNSSVESGLGLKTKKETLWLLWLWVKADLSPLLFLLLYKYCDFISLFLLNVYNSSSFALYRCCHHANFPSVGFIKAFYSIMDKWHFACSFTFNQTRRHSHNRGDASWWQWRLSCICGCIRQQLLGYLWRLGCCSVALVSESSSDRLSACICCSRLPC